MLLALASGAALLAIVGWSLVQTAAQAQEREELAARRDARDLAVALRAALRTPAVLDLVPADARFDVHDGSVRIDDEVGWLHELPPATADAVVAERLRQAQLAEFVARDPAAAAAQFDELLGPRGPDGDARLPVLVAAAWQATRAGDAARIADRTHQLEQALATRAPAATADPRLAHAVAATLLLAAARQQPLPKQAVALFAALPADLAVPTLARLRERGVVSEPLAAAHQAVAARRHLLADATRALRELPTHATARGLGDRLLLWFPSDGAPGHGTGALLARDWLATLPGLGSSRPAPAANLPPVPDRGTLQFVAAPPDAEDVVPGWCWVAPLARPDVPWFASPAAILGAAGVLVLVFAASAFAMLRAFRREADSLRARSEFLTGVTHELKTPVASMRLVAEVMRDDDVSPQKQREYMALLAGETTRLAALVDNVLDLGQMERGERAYDLRPGDLAEVVRDVFAAFAPLAQRSGLALTLHEGRAQAPALVDGNALAQALLNVGENARKYAAAGGQLTITTTADGPSFRIVVRDFGPGVAEPEREVIFARFQRGRAHRHGSIPGVGLGLYLARCIVERHGGTLRCEEPPAGPGACFVFTLPLLESAT